MVFMRKVILMGIVAVLVLSLAGCGQPETLVSGASVEKPEITDISDKNVIVTDLAVRLLQTSFSQKENVLISPISVLSGLSLIANGVDGDSLAQIEEVVGLTAEKLNEYICSYGCHLSETSGKNSEPYLANSLWINEDRGVTVSDKFLQANEVYCNASIYQVPFDETCTKYTNNWIKDQTQGIIEHMINEVSEDATMYLVNSLAFEGVWKLRSRSGEQSVFKNIDGTTHSAEDIVANREGGYIEDNDTDGFVKYFGRSKYAFAALLPKEGINISTYIQSLTGQKLHNLLSNVVDNEVNKFMPGFSFSYEEDMANILRRMGLEGIEDIFDKSQADFSGFGYAPEGKNLHIDNFFYKTSIDIDGNGMNTNARAAVTEEIFTCDEAMRTVNIDRPFIIVLMDSENCIPILIGTVVYLPIEDSFSEEVLKKGLFEESKVQKCINSF